MSIVRYTNKKTGVVTVYESTSHYDPETKQSRPKRKYLGIEDTETGALIPSSGKRGRKSKAAESVPVKQDGINYFKLRYEELKKESSLKDKKIVQLEREVRRLRCSLLKLQDIAAEALQQQPERPDV